MSDITLSGYAGTDKFTIAELLSKNLDYSFISMGNYTRQIAEQKYGMSINDS